MKFKEVITTLAGLLIMILSGINLPWAKAFKYLLWVILNLPWTSVLIFLFGGALFCFSFHTLENAWNWLRKKVRL